jgi:16S rRNA (adenine1518-N6/adenine1519-N6)-dimethyltransferase
MRGMTLTEVRAALAEHDIRPSKSLGQNFLVDGNILRIVVEQAHIRSDETVVEVGPGLGALTEQLLARARRVIAVERDRRLCEVLRRRFPELELIEGDAVKEIGAVARQAGEDFKVVANLPYSISSPLLERLVEGEPKPWMMALMLQREVGERLGATPRQKEYGALSLFTQLPYHVTVAHIVSPRCFFPRPNVESAIVILERREPRVHLEKDAPFHDIVRTGFSQRRKMLRKLLADYGDVESELLKLGAAAMARAEELGLEQWIRLANALRPGKEPRL